MIRRLPPVAGSMAALFSSGSALACPTCAQDRGPAVFLIGLMSLLPLLLAAAVFGYLRRVERAEGREV